MTHSPAPNPNDHDAINRSLARIEEAIFGNGTSSGLKTRLALLEERLPRMWWRAIVVSALVGALVGTGLDSFIPLLL